jgi:ribosomal protein S18 acetylase RimI-like enzyme
MISVNSVNTVLNVGKSVREGKKGYLTNFFLDVPKTELWIRLDLFFYEVIGETAFLFRKNQGFFNLYFITTSLEVLDKDINALKTLFPGELFVVDIIGRENDNQNIRKIFGTNGFYPYASLVRMSKMNGGTDSAERDSAFISYADRLKSQNVYDLLQYFFNPYAEQLPLSDEIDNLQKKNGILVYSDDNHTIQGFLIFEIIGMTSYLRYWFVHPEHRDKKIGSSLLRRFFEEGKGTKRQLFWVIESNENAIKRYEHYGFIKEPLFDNIMINKNICYGG